MMKEILEKIECEDAIFVEKEDGTKVKYFIFPEFEVYLNQIVPSIVQRWHVHQKIEEIIVVIEGEIRVETIKHGGIDTKDCKMGDLIRTNRSIHRISNMKTIDAKFVVFRFVPQDEDNREVIKADKVVYSKKEIAFILKK